MIKNYKQLSPTQRFYIPFLLKNKTSAFANFAHGTELFDGSSFANLLNLHLALGL